MFPKIKYFIEQSWLLLVSSFIFGLLLAVTSSAWSPRIEQNKIAKLQSLMKNLLPEAADFQQTEKVEIDVGKGKKATANVYKALDAQNQCVGWAFNCEGPGFADKVELVVAVDSGFQKIEGYDCLAANETPGFGDRIKQSYYRSQFAGAPAQNLQLSKTGDASRIDSQIVAITGATVSSQAVVNIINNFLLPVKKRMHEKGLIANDQPAKPM